MSRRQHPVWVGLRNERHRNGLTIAGLAAAVGTRSVSVIGAWERGVYQPDLFQTDEVAGPLGLRLGLVPTTTPTGMVDIPTLDMVKEFIDIAAGRRFDMSRRV
jgi:transcriptional regulator with XRE-family HTH domain